MFQLVQDISLFNFGHERKINEEFSKFDYSE